MTPRIGNGLDVHPFASSPKALVLGGVEIPGADGLEGHSDADVVAHALMDALLGALALGDLGSRFGVDEEGLKDADSVALLGLVVGDTQAHGFHIGNVDITVVAQRPRLAEHRPAMRQRLAEVLEVEIEQVSIKATTTDGLGAIGRGEGIACWATVLLSRS